MNIKNYHEACEALYPYLSEYLQEHGIDASKLFRCISPTHEDRDPSMGIAPSGKAFHCFSCGYSGGIFHAAHVLEGKPMVGQDFILDNLIPLAEKYGVEIESQPLTEEQLYELDTYRAYRAAADLVKTAKRTNDYTSAVKARGWTEETCREFGVGCVPDYNKFRDALKSMGFRAGFLDDVDLGRREIFGEDKLVFPIRDERGRPVGFSSRNLTYTDDKQHGAKYVNQRGTGVKCNIYKKSTRLYGFDRVLAKHNSKPQPIYIFEGYSDVVTAVQHGIDSCVGLGGTSLTLDQLILLKKHKYYDLILCLDGDEPGLLRVASLLDHILSGHKDLKIRIVIMPGGQDPDEYIREYGLDKFKKLKKWTAFEWRLAQFSEETEPENVCESMIPLVVNETSYVAQEKMCKTLAKETGISLKTIQHELERLQDQKSRDKANERQVILDRLVIDCKKDPVNAESSLQVAQDELFSLARKYEEDSFSEEATLAVIHNQKSYEESKDGSFSGFRLGPDLAGLEQALCGEWKKDVWFCIGGKPNCFPKHSLFLDPQTGKMVTADKLKGVASYSTEENCLVNNRVTEYLDSDIKECFEVIVERGYKIVTSADHRYLTPRGFKKLSELEIGDKVAQPNYINYSFPETIDSQGDQDLGAMLGLMIGDGNYTTARPLFCNDDPRNFIAIEAGIHHLDPDLQLVDYEVIGDYRMVGVTQKNWKTNRTSSGQCQSNALTTWLQELGIWGQKKAQKVLPEYVFSASRDFIAGVLSGLFSSDGSIYSYHGKYSKHTIEFCTVSETLARQVQHLLLRFGINAGLSYKSNDYQGAWIVKFSNKALLVKFWKHIGFIFNSRKAIRLSELCKNELSFVEQETPPISWVKIKSIESVGPHECCDITVDIDHNFVVDGFVLHNSGKSSMMVKLTTEIASHYKENNATVIYHTIDDTAEQLLPKFVCVAEGSRKLSLNQVMDPNYHSRNTGDEQRKAEVVERRNDGYLALEDLVRDGRIVIKDANEGASLAYIERLIKYYREKYPDRNLVYVLDNFHKLTDFGAGKADERVRMKEISKIVKNLATKYHICIITTVEYRKTANNQRASNQDVAETIQIEYDANLIAHVHNELHDKGEKCPPQLVHYGQVPDLENNAIRMPVIEFDIGKNKVTAFKERLYMEFFPSCSDFAGVDEAIILSRKAAEDDSKPDATFFGKEK